MFIIYAWEGGFCCSVIESCPILCNPTDCSPAGSSVHRISQARILEWVAISYSRDLPDPGIKPTCLVPPVIGRRILYHCTTLEALLHCIFPQLLHWMFPTYVLPETWIYQGHFFACSPSDTSLFPIPCRLERRVLWFPVAIFIPSASTWKPSLLWDLYHPTLLSLCLSPLQWYPLISINVRSLRFL